MNVLTRDPRGESASAAEPTAPGGAAPRRHTLRLPHGLKSARFGLAVALILAAGLVSMLIVNTSLAGDAIELGGLEAKLARANERHEALEAEVDALSSPGALQLAASGMGMVPATAPAFLDPATGTVSGALDPAAPLEKPFAPAPQVAAPPQPAPAPTAAPTDAPQPSGASPAAVAPRSPSPAAPADPGADGAVIVAPSPAPSPASSAAPTPTPAPTPSPAPAPAGGDSATVVAPEVN